MFFTSSGKENPGLSGMAQEGVILFSSFKEYSSRTKYMSGKAIYSEYVNDYGTVLPLRSSQSNGEDSHAIFMAERLVPTPL